MSHLLNKFIAIAWRMEKLKPLAFPGPVNDLEVEQAELELDVAFPESYKWFLKRFGAADFPFEIYGLQPAAIQEGSHGFWNVVDMTKSEREDAEPPMPDCLVAFNPDGMGNHYCLNTSDFRYNECPVVFWRHDMEEKQELEQTHTTFLDWLEERITAEEEYYKDNEVP